MVDIFDEVSDDLRSERAVRLLRRYGGLALAAAVLVVLAVAAQQAWAWHQARRDDAAAAAFLKIGQQMDSPGAAAPSNDQSLATAAQYAGFAKTAPAGYRDLAALRAAGLYAAGGQTGTAAGLWNTVAADASADPLLRDLANLLWAQHELGVAPDADVAARLAPLSASQNPFHGLAQETQALLFVRQGKIDQAKGLFTQIAADPGAPDGVRNRADGLLAKLNG